MYVRDGRNGTGSDFKSDQRLIDKAPSIGDGVFDNVLVLLTDLSQTIGTENSISCTGIEENWTITDR